MNAVSGVGDAHRNAFNRRDFFLSLLLFIVLLSSLWVSFGYMSWSRANKALSAILALVVGVAGIWTLFYLANRIISSLGSATSAKLVPYVFVAPAILLLVLYLLYPMARTLVLSFYDASGTTFVGLSNYKELFTSESMLIVLRNTLMWIVLAPLFSVTFGLLVAVMTDHLSPRWEKIVKSTIFLPMAISSIGASVIWRFVYYYQPVGYRQIGLLNAIFAALGGDPQAWYTQIPWQETAVPWFNNVFLIVIMVWLQTGFAMVILSAAVKSVPKQLIEAARVDGAREVGIFFAIIIPYIKGSIITVTTTILISVLKVFDIVFVMTSGQFDTDVVASRMFIETFKFRNFGLGSALSVLLFIGVIPFIIRNIRLYREHKI